MGVSIPSALGGISRGAGCIVEFEGLGNEIGGTVEAEGLELASELLPNAEFELDENPLEGELLKMSKPLEVLPGLLEIPELFEPMGGGPETSGMV